MGGPDEPNYAVTHPIYHQAMLELHELGMSERERAPATNASGEPDFPVIDHNMHLLEDHELLALQSLINSWLRWVTDQVAIRDSICVQMKTFLEEAEARATIAIEREYVGQRLSAARRKALIRLSPEVVAANEHLKVSTTVLDGYKGKRDSLRGSLFTVQSTLRTRERRKSDQAAARVLGVPGTVHPVARPPAPPQSVAQPPQPKAPTGPWSPNLPITTPWRRS